MKTLHSIVTNLIKRSYLDLFWPQISHLRLDYTRCWEQGHSRCARAFFDGDDIIYCECIEIQCINNTHIFREPETYVLICIYCEAGDHPRQP